MPMSVPRTNPSPARSQLPANAISHERFHPGARPNPANPHEACPRLPAAFMVREAPGMQNEPTARSGRDSARTIAARRTCEPEPRHPLRATIPHERIPRRRTNEPGGRPMTRNCETNPPTPPSRTNECRPVHARTRAPALGFGRARGGIRPCGTAASVGSFRNSSSWAGRRVRSCVAWE